jgi:MFS family permease
MLLFSPIICSVCVYTAVAYGILYMLFTTFSFVYIENYNFSVSATVLTFIPLGVGMILSLGIMGTVTDRTIKGKQARGETVKPEDRLPLGIVLAGAISMPAGLFIYGWTVQYSVHWIVPMIGTAFCGFGMLIIFVSVAPILSTSSLQVFRPLLILKQMAMQTYLIDAFTRYAASAVAANTVLRSLFGGLLPLSGLRLYNALGFGWGNSLLGFISIALIPIPALFSIYGERIRTNPRFQLNLERVSEAIRPEFGVARTFKS